MGLDRIFFHFDDWGWLTSIPMVELDWITALLAWQELRTLLFIVLCVYYPFKLLYYDFAVNNTSQLD